MKALKDLIKTIIPNELSQDEGVKNNSFVLDPYILGHALNGDGLPQEIFTEFQLDIFFKNKGELIAKSKAITETLGAYPVEDFIYTWESTARLWRGTTIIELIGD